MQEVGLTNITGGIGFEHSLKFGWKNIKWALRVTYDNMGDSTSGFGSD